MRIHEFAGMLLIAGAALASCNESALEPARSRGNVEIIASMVYQLMDNATLEEIKEALREMYNNSTFIYSVGFGDFMTQ